MQDSDAGLAARLENYLNQITDDYSSHSYEACTGSNLTAPRNPGQVKQLLKSKRHLLMTSCKVITLNGVACTLNPLYTVWDLNMGLVWFVVGCRKQKNTSVMLENLFETN